MDHDQTSAEFNTSAEPQNGYASATDAFRASAQHFGELKEYVAYYIAAKIDGLKLSVRNLVLYIALAVMAGIVGAAVLAASAVLLMLGIANGLGTLLGGRYWLGDLIVGLAVLGGLAAAVLIIFVRLKAASRHRTVSKYEARRNHQQTQFDHNVAERAAAAGRVAN